MKKNINTALQNTWLSTAYLIVLSFVLLVSQLGFAKDRIQYHVQNFDGSILKVINEQGVVSQSYQYAPFGQQLQLKKPSNLKNPRAFVGGVQDANDLVYLKQRHYNPVLGRFYQPDPITFISGGHGQTNRYQYGWNDSYTFKDPNGDTPVALPFFVLGVWILDNFRSDAYQPEINTLPSGIGDNLLLAYSGASLINQARLASMTAAELNYYQIAQSSSVSPVLWLTSAGKTVDQYALVAQRDGFYPVMKWGYKEPQGGIWLSQGDIWKYGTTKNPTTRYPASYLNNTGNGLQYQQMMNGTLKQALEAEKNRITIYRDTRGILPPGNKMVK
ncbi:RHS repeat-associated core domain-containing protein [Acinetobacter baumannii]|uniref:RHS repeat-associated core domain-containing protein n=1 Tax=Acinetobacter baumannii TaxID=470 RepID=UPI003211E80F